MTTADVLCQGWDMEGMREAGDAASYAHTPSSPGFTAINHCSTQSSSPIQASQTSSAQPRSAIAASAGECHRRRNPTVASYLGLGDSDEPAHLAKYASTSDGAPPPLQPTRKRRSTRHAEKAAPWKKPTTSSKATTSQRRVSESLRVTKSAGKAATRKLNGSAEGHLPTPAATGPSTKLLSSDHRTADLQDPIKETSSGPELELSSKHPSALIVDDDDDNDFGQLCFDFEINSRNANSSKTLPNTQEHPAFSQTMINDEDFDDDDLMDDDLLDLLTDAISVPGSPLFQSSSPVKPNASHGLKKTQRTPQTSTMSDDASNEQISSSSRASNKFVSPVTLTYRILAATGDEARKPIVRAPFPTAVRDRSPIIGMSSNTVLRSCFRVGEAISQSCHAVKAGSNILIELYARVLNSERDDLQQRFTFCDLFHAKPPYISATYAAAIWKSVQLFEYDSARLMQQGRICRCIGTMERNGKDWTMTVLNIWEAAWDDVRWVEGIVNS
ncbi:hypothetical protein E8E11_003859 [Didymella keratinophila]|nr:hypothetical protein E8E11_003859 [Didymella keratinophila]